MARQFEITRTISSTKVSVMCADISIGETVTNDYIVAGHYDDDTKLLKVIKKQYETETLKPVAIVDKTDADAMYGMTVNDFIENGTPLDPETRKPLN